MKKKRIAAVAIAVLLVLACFISCNSEMDGRVGLSSVSFAPSVSKALNQSGSSVEFSKNVNDYKWKYYCSTAYNANTITATDWKDFTDVTVGLGSIKDLFKGDSYYFGLQGYSTDTDELIWEGFHFGSDGKTPEAVQLNTKKQIVTIDVYTKGEGYLYFSVSAPNMSMDNVTGTGELKEGRKADRFAFSYESLDGKVTGSDFVVSTSYNSETNYWIYEDVPGTPNRSLPAGTYLFTVKQQTWDPEKPVEGAAEPGDYTDVVERAQILIVNIVSGVDTVIAGTLDSAGLVPFEYYAYSEDDRYGIQLAWHTNVGNVESLGLYVYDNSTNVRKVINNHDIIKVNVGEYVTIDWTTEADVVLYMNGDKLSTETDNDGYYIRAEGDKEWSYIKALSAQSVQAWAGEGQAYIITVEKGGKTMSFTIKAISSDTDSVFGTKKVTDFTTDTTVSSGDAKVKMTSASQIDSLPEDVKTSYTDDYDLEMNYSLKFYESGRTVNKVDYQLSMSVQAKLVSGTDVLKTESYELTTPTSEPMVVSIDLGKNLDEVKLYKDSNLVPSVYKLEDGSLTFSTTELGEFNVTFKSPQMSVNFLSGTDVYRTSVVPFGDKVADPQLSDTKNGLATFFKDENFTTPFDFDTVITTDTDVYIQWVKSFTVVFDKNCDEATYTGVSSYTDVSYKAKITKPIDPVYTNHPFTGWFRDADCTEQWNFATDKVTDDITLYAGYMNPYLTFRSSDSFGVRPAYNSTYFCDPTLYWSTNSNTWTKYNDTGLVNAALGDDGKYYVYFYGTSNTDKVFAYNKGGSGIDYWHVTGSGVEILGNIETLIDAPSVIRGEHPVMTREKFFAEMFRYQTSIIKAPDLGLLTLTKECYYQMFRGCTSLTDAPKIAATTLASRCCVLMFEGCSSLTRATELPATKMEYQCYVNMFLNTGIEVSTTEDKGLGYFMLPENITTTVYSGEWNDGMLGSGTSPTPGVKYYYTK